MRTLDELDRLHAAATAGEWVVRSYQEPSGEWAPAPSWETYGEDNLTLTAALKNAWPSVSARLRAAEAEVERLRRLCRVAAERIDDDALALAELLDDQDAPVDGGALTDALSRAALGAS